MAVPCGPSQFRMVYSSGAVAVASSAVCCGNALFNFRRVEIFKACQLRICLGFYAVELGTGFLLRMFLFLHTHSERE